MYTLRFLGTIYALFFFKPVRPFCLRTARLIYAEGAYHYHPHRHLHPQHLCLTTSPMPFRFSSFYRGFTVSLAGIIPYAGTAFLTWGYLRANLVAVALDARDSFGRSQHRCSRGRPHADSLLPFLGGAPTNASWWADTAWAIPSPEASHPNPAHLFPVQQTPMNAVSLVIWQGMKRFLGL